MTKKERLEAQKRLEAYREDMKNGRIDLSECIELTPYPSEQKVKSSQTTSGKSKRNLKKS